MKSFGSDNHSGIHPDILSAISVANTGHVQAYGDDIYTEKAVEAFRQIFGEQTDVYFVFNGTGANVLSLGAAAESFHAVVCADTAHINVDECGAVERGAGCKLLPVAAVDGKLTPELISTQLHGFGFQHHSQPRVVSISEPSELGTVYSVDEIRAIAYLVHSHGMFLHVDGARFAGAVVATGVEPRALTVDAGVDIMSFGGTKNGMMCGEAVLIFNDALKPDFIYRRKQMMQLGSKMRFVAAQFSAYLEEGLWLRMAEHSALMARRLADRVATIEGVSITRPTDANGVFAILPPEAIKQLSEKYCFYVWDEATHEVRWMTSFDTSEEDVDGFAEAIAAVMKSIKQ